MDFTRKDRYNQFKPVEIRCLSCGLDALLRGSLSNVEREEALKLQKEIRNVLKVWH